MSRDLLLVAIVALGVGVTMGILSERLAALEERTYQLQRELLWYRDENVGYANRTTDDIWDLNERVNAACCESSHIPEGGASEPW